MRWKSNSPCLLLRFIPFYCSFVTLGIVCEPPSCLVSSARVLTRSFVNFGEKNRILDCTRGPPEICFGFVHDTTYLSSIFPNYLNYILLLIFPTESSQTICGKGRLVGEIERSEVQREVRDLKEK